MNSEIQNEITEKSAHETKCSNQKYILKLSSRLSFYIFIVLIENISQSFIVLEKCPEDEQIISCSSHQIPKMLQEYYRIALLTRKVAYHPQQVTHPTLVTSYICEVLHDAMKHFTAAEDLSQSFQRGCHISHVMEDLLPNLIFF